MKVNKIEARDEQVDKLSLVASPANGENINVCSMAYCGIDYERRTITSKVLEADVLMFRRLPSNRYIYFTRGAVLNLAGRFLEGVNNTALSVDHYPINSPGLKLQQSYVVDGLWKVVIRIEDDEIWSRVVSGELKGVSIELVTREETVLNVTDDIDKFKEDALALDEDTRNIIFGALND